MAPPNTTALTLDRSPTTIDDRVETNRQLFLFVVRENDALLEIKNARDQRMEELKQRTLRQGERLKDSGIRLVKTHQQLKKVKQSGEHGEKMNQAVASSRKAVEIHRELAVISRKITSDTRNEINLLYFINDKLRLLSELIDLVKCI
jgi:hypothetical protein